MKYINIFYDFKKLMFVIYFIIKYLKFYLISYKIEFHWII